jgi:glycosyltransferase involved in cell wall biosynthesis
LNPATVAVVIPARDEEEALPEVLRSIPRAGAGWNVRTVLVADNGSRDRTAQVARLAGAQVVSESRPGYGAACLAAIERLRLDPPQVVVFLDGDGSDDPVETPRILAPIVAGDCDLVIGSRTMGAREPGSLTVAQEAGNRIATGLMRVLFGARFTDLGPFRAIRWTALERLSMRDRDYGWTVEMQARAARAGLRCSEVAVRHRRRRAGRSKVAGTLRGAAGAGWKILITIARVRLGG